MGSGLGYRMHWFGILILILSLTSRETWGKPSHLSKLRFFDGKLGPDGRCLHGTAGRLESRRYLTHAVGAA